MTSPFDLLNRLRGGNSGFNRNDPQWWKPDPTNMSNRWSYQGPNQPSGGLGGIGPYGFFQPKGPGILGSGMLDWMRGLSGSGQPQTAGTGEIDRQDLMRRWGAGELPELTGAGGNLDWSKASFLQPPETKQYTGDYADLLTQLQGMRQNLWADKAGQTKLIPQQQQLTGDSSAWWQDLLRKYSVKQ